jgi:monoamine oxidase
MYEQPLYEQRLAFAGEHTVMAMFGYVEGALESGLIAAGRIMGVGPFLANIG